jgi:hypothetical protein
MLEFFRAHAVRYVVWLTSTDAENVNRAEITTIFMVPGRQNATSLITSGARKPAVAFHIIRRSPPS